MCSAAFASTQFTNRRVCGPGPIVVSVLLLSRPLSLLPLRPFETRFWALFGCQLPWCAGAMMLCVNDKILIIKFLFHYFIVVDITFGCITTHYPLLLYQAAQKRVCKEKAFKMCYCCCWVDCNGLNNNGKYFSTKFYQRQIITVIMNFIERSQSENFTSRVMDPRLDWTLSYACVTSTRWLVGWNVSRVRFTWVIPRF